MKKRALVFAGQGAQAVGMGKDLCDAYPECKALFAKADDVLGRSLSGVCFNGPIEALTRTDNCQPAIFVASVACLKAVENEVGGAVQAVGMAGLSLGEWTALHAAGVLSFEDAVRVLQARGRFMQEACDAAAGGMISILGLSKEVVEKIAKESGLEVANFNSPEQTVLSGAKDRIPAAEKLAKEAGAKRSVILGVAGAYHSSFMGAAAKNLESFIAGVTFRTPSVPVVSNVTGLPHGSPDDIKRAVVRQVTSPVQWVATVEWFKQAGVVEYVEFGPGKVLSGLVKRIDPAAAALNVQDAATVKSTAAAVRI